MASQAQESIMEDDAVLYYTGAPGQAAALDEMAAAGVDTIHTIARWRFFAPKAKSSKRPKHFDGRNPGDYPESPWNTLDDLIRGAQARGMQVLLSPAPPAPRWAGRCKGRAAKRYGGICKPDPRLYGQFVQALAKRYSGRYPDESDGRLLPAVRRWSIWNEPNLSSWLYPQVQHVRGQTVYSAAVAYRGLVRAATAGLRAGGHRGDQVLLGETAPLGNGSAQTAPARFYRTLFCLDAHGRRMRGREAAANGCSHGPARLAVNGVAHHPYTRGAGTPFYKRVGRDDITIGSLSRLSAVMRQGAKAGAVPRGLSSSLYLTEFGVSSKPPGKRYSVPLRTQALWLNQADYIAYRNPAVRSVAQYELRDNHGYSRTTFQTGLCFDSSPCSPKLAWHAYQVPLYVVKRGGSVTIFGGARRGNNGSAETIDIQHGDGSGDFTTVRNVPLNRMGWFTASLPYQAGPWRLQWTPAGGGPALYSRWGYPQTR
jgi:hypothetical protein